MFLNDPGRHRTRGSTPRHSTSTTEANKDGYHNRKGYICSNICSLLRSLIREPSKYDEIAPKIGYWIEYVLCEDFLTVDELVGEISYVAWDVSSGSFASAGKFLKEFRDAPHRSEQARTFVTQMCSHVLRWFAITSVEGVRDTRWHTVGISIGGGPGFIRAASFVGYLIEWGLLSRELVRRHLTKSLTNHMHGNDSHVNSPGYIRASAIYQLFAAAGNTLLQGLLEPDDVQACFNMLDAWSQRRVVCNAAELEVQYTACDDVSPWA